MTIDPFTELLEVSNRKDLAETGGGHNQKGIEFQRHWAVMRMFELEQDGEKDFLLLFEAIQDVAVLDSSTVPTCICVYQIKKKDRKEWSWADLTGLHQPKDPSKASKNSKDKPLAAIQNSPIGKLYATVHAFKELNSSGRFISNAGCDVPLADGTNAATSLPTALSNLSPLHIDLLSKGLETIHASGEPIPDLSLIHLERVVLNVDDPGTHIVGMVHKFLENRSPRHAGQARALVDALLAKIGPLGAKTDHCKSFEEMRGQRGYSKAEFNEALGSLENTPDQLAILEVWLQKLSQEGMSFLETTSIQVAATAIYRRQVMGARSIEENKLIEACDNRLATAPEPIELQPFIQAAYDQLHDAHPAMKKAELLAHFLLRAIKKCVDQT